MKKIISLILSVAMLVMLIASCGANTDTTTTAATTEAITTEVTTVATTEATTVATTEATTVATTPSPVTELTFSEGSLIAHWDFSEISADGTIADLTAMAIQVRFPATYSLLLHLTVTAFSSLATAV